MKKKIIFINITIIFLSLVLLFGVSILSISHINKESVTNEIKNYLNICKNIYDGTNDEEVIASFKNNKEIRITIIDLNGVVLSDSIEQSEYENHLERPEIKSLNTIFYRYSNTYKTKMMYIACFDDNSYIRVAIPQKTINSFVKNYLLYGIIGLVLILVLSILLIVYTIKKSFKQLVTQVNKLSSIANKERNVIGDDFEVLSERIDEVGNIINQKITTINYEKDKLNYIINSIDIGIIVINAFRNVEIINNKALEIFNISKNDIVNQNYLYLSREIDFQERIKQANIDRIKLEYQAEFNNKIYIVRISSVNNIWDDTAYLGVLVNFIDITDIKKLEKSKKEFFANASHELKSPLTSIIGYQQMIQEGIITQKDEIKDATNKTIKEANRMNEIIIEMLALSKLESNYQTNYEDIKIKDLVNDIIDSYKEDIINDNIQLDIKISDDVIKMNKLDCIMLFKNTFENAVKYNKKNGFISVVFNKDYLEIKDTGIGISEDNIEHIFERFFRVDKGYSRSKNGTGLGLAIVKHICLNYNYQVVVESELNKGTTITVKFK